MYHAHDVFVLQRSYWYTRGDFEHDESAADGISPLCIDPDTGSNQTSPCAGSTPRNPLDMPLLRKSWIDADYTDETVNPKVCIIVLVLDTPIHNCYVSS